MHLKTTTIILIDLMLRRQRYQWFDGRTTIIITREMNSTGKIMNNRASYENCNDKINYRNLRETVNENTDEQNGQL